MTLDLTPLVLAVLVSAAGWCAGRLLGARPPRPPEPTEERWP